MDQEKMSHFKAGRIIVDSYIVLIISWNVQSVDICFCFHFLCWIAHTWMFVLLMTCNFCSPLSLFIFRYVKYILSVTHIQRFWNTIVHSLDIHMPNVNYIWHMDFYFACLILSLGFHKSLHFSNMQNKTGVINDSLGQIHSLASSEHCFHVKFVLFF